MKKQHKLLTKETTIDFESLKRGVIYQSGLLASTFGSGVSALIPRQADNPMKWIQGLNISKYTDKYLVEFIRERDRYAKHEAFIQKSTMKKSIPEERQATLSFDADF